MVTYYKSKDVKFLSKNVKVREFFNTPYFNLFDICKSMGIKTTEQITQRYLTKQGIMNYLLTKHGSVNTVKRYDDILSRMLDGKPNNRGCFSKKDASKYGYVTNIVTVVYTEKCKLRYLIKPASNDIWVALIDLSRNLGVNHGILRKAMVRSKNFNLKEIPIICSDGLHHVTTCIHFDDLDKLIAFIPLYEAKRHIGYHSIGRISRERYISEAKNAINDHWDEFRHTHDTSTVIDYNVASVNEDDSESNILISEISQQLMVVIESILSKSKDELHREIIDYVKSILETMVANSKQVIGKESTLKKIDKSKTVSDSNENKELRRLINDLIKTGVNTGEEVTDRWHDLYAKLGDAVGFSFKEVFDVVSKSKDKRFKAKLDIVEKLGYLPLMHSIAEELFSD